MKILTRAWLISVVLALPVAALAQGDAAPKSEAPKAATPVMMMNCPMMAGTGDLQKEFGAMLGDVEGMMKGTKEAETKDRLQKMHEHMAVMMARMQTMQSIMGAMMQGGIPGTPPAGSPAPGTQAAPAPASPGDHAAHRPAQ